MVRVWDLFTTFDMFNVHVIYEDLKKCIGPMNPAKWFKVKSLLNKGTI